MAPRPISAPSSKSCRSGGGAAGLAWAGEAPGAWVCWTAGRVDSSLGGPSAGPATRPTRRCQKLVLPPLAMRPILGALRLAAAGQSHADGDDENGAADADGVVQAVHMGLEPFVHGRVRR